MATTHWTLQSQNNNAPDIIKSSCPSEDHVHKLVPYQVDHDEASSSDSGASIRSFYTYIPPKLCSTLKESARHEHTNYTQKQLRIVLAIHGYSGRPLQEIKKWHDVAASLNAIILAPQGTPTPSEHGYLGFNAIHCCGDPVKNEIDDVDFIINGVVGTILGALGSVVGGDTTMNAHVIATGFSNGGFMSSLLGLLRPQTRPSWLVGIVPTGGYQYNDKLYEGSPPTSLKPGPLPIMSHHGGKDSVVNPEGCCALSSGNELRSNCQFDIGIKQEMCTSAKHAFEMWASINGCASIMLDEDIVNDRLLKNNGKKKDKTEPIYTCWKGKDCIESARTNFCMWNLEGHSWGFQFPGLGMAQSWMEEVYRQSEIRSSSASEEAQTTNSKLVDDPLRKSDESPISYHHSTTGRFIFSAAVTLLIVVSLIIQKKANCGSCKQERKRKTSEENLHSDSDMEMTVALKT